MSLPNNGPEFCLIVGAARSGTTLTRLLLDSHPEIGCPSEAGIPALMSHMASVWTTVHADHMARARQLDPGVPVQDPQRSIAGTGPSDKLGDAGAEGKVGAEADKLPADARDWIVGTIREPMAQYCARGSKRVYVDKSLDSVFHLGLVQELLPSTKMILLFRHVMDTVASGHEASPWGFNAYGYTRYVQGSVGNTVAALASYWLDHVTQALDWERDHADSCLRVRYEDLVTEPEETVRRMQDFLGVREDLSVLTAAFDRDPPRGPGDYKVQHTMSVQAKSIGHGKHVPVALLPPALLTALNKQLEKLGYPPLDQSWNSAERDVDAGGTGLWAERLRTFMGRAVISSMPGRVEQFAILAEDHRRLRWVVDVNAGTVRQGDGDVDGVLTGTAENLVLALSKEQNLGVLLRSGRIRYLTGEELDVGAGVRRDNFADEMDEILTVLDSITSAQG